MFAIVNYRRKVAVLTALALVASVLVAAPVSAADDPKADYPATFSACEGVPSSGFTEGVPSSGFTDVPAGHANAGDIDCIAYYGITKGTSATTYSPLNSVTREHMALFLTRLAGRVGIEMAADPADSGFTDTGDLSANSQTAINQLADLGITKGTSTTTYSPEDSVERGHMALFIARLMDLMDPMAEDSDTVFGYTPEDVVDVDDSDDTDDVDDSKTVNSPFADLGSVTKTAYDAITALWELGVASGISDTAYAPSALITRAAMAEFMTGVLDHSNARPAGVSIQASKTWAFDSFDATVAVSYRDDNFAPMVDVSIKTFHSGNDGAEDGVGSFTDDGGCEMAADCAWSDDESLTDDSGNSYISGGVTDGKMNTYYAWMGDEDNTDFDVDKSDHASVTLSSTTDATKLKVASSISSNSTTKNTVDIDATSSVTYTVQLVDGSGADVAKSGVEISVAVVQGGSPRYPGPAPLKTDDDGQVTYTTGGPKSTKGATDDAREDTVTFTSDVDASGTVGDADTGETSENTINWSDTDAALTSAKGDAPSYAVMDSKDEVTIRAMVTLYDQYGNTIGKGNTVEIDIGDGTATRRTVSSRGVASWRDTVDAGSPGDPITITYGDMQDSDGTDLTSPPTVADSTVTAVRHAPDDSSADAADIDAVYGDDNRFRIDGLLYTYDSGDVFVDGTGDGAVVDMAKFETLIGVNLDTIATEANIQIVSYDDDGDSIFRVVTDAS